jgi:adenosylcobinamide kinase/adenosylcobinamide-phosphate guanylyltransferase
MGNITLLTGGARSGKSTHALNLASECTGAKLFIATAVAFDEEMTARIAKHVTEREGKGFSTIEAPYDLAHAVRNLKAGVSVVVVDCVTVWLGNLFHKYGEDDASVDSAVREFVDIIGKQDARFYIVTNEVGMSIVPENKLARRFRDMSGLMNRRLAQISDSVFLCVCGIPLKIK